MKINPSPTLQNLGGKGYHLNLLKRICTVPKFFVIKFDILEEIEDENVQKQILDYFTKMKLEIVSVRSSATVEDGVNSSFAGMFDSVLNVNRNNLIEAIKEVVNSVKGQRVIEYCKLKGIDYKKVGMRVVVQKMIDSKISGVCFTKTPDSDKQMVIEACLGLGEALVSGKVTPDNYVINRNTLDIVSASIGFQKIMLKQSEYEEIPFHKRNAKKLSNEQIQELSKIALEIENSLNFYGADIEFAVEGDILYILQARSITFISEEEKEDAALPNIQNYQMVFKVSGIGFMFADLLCYGFGYLHPLFICTKGKFLQYFTNEKMQYAASYGYDWLSTENGFDKHREDFTNFHKISFAKLQNIINGELTIETTRQFFDIVYQYFIFYSKTDFQFTNTVYLYVDKNPTIAENLKKLSEFKDIARVWINDVSTDENCYLNRLLLKMSDKFKTDIDILGLYKIAEIINLFNNVKVEDSEIKERRIGSVLMFDGQNTKYVCGEEAIKYIENVRKTEQVQEKAEIIGQVANKGNVRFVTGRVKVINVDYDNFSKMEKEIDEMNKGEILVSESTAPELMGACSKAKAIITDMGGLLSHAAIVSREFGIPCVVGTVHASRSLKDGDKIEIDLENGTVRKSIKK